MAFRFRKAVRESLGRIRQYPRIGSLYRGSIRGLRSWPVKGFEIIRIYYIEESDGLRVVRILHGSRNVRQILRERETCPGVNESTATSIRVVSEPLRTDLVGSFLHRPVAANLYRSKLALPRLATHASIHGDKGTGQLFKKTTELRTAQIPGTTLPAHVIKNHG